MLKGFINVFWTLRQVWKNQHIYVSFSVREMEHKSKIDNKNYYKCFYSIVITADLTYHLFLVESYLFSGVHTGHSFSPSA